MFSRSLLRPLLAQSRRLAPASYSTPAAPAAPRSHTTDTYSKEVDSTPAPDPKIHRVDPSSENVQKPHEPPSGPWSATGVEAGVKNAQGQAKGNGEKKTGIKEYSTMSGENPYQAPAQNERYGGKTQYQEENGHNPQESNRSVEKDGPQGSESGGRKPEGR
ncbi:hypothetical protein B0H10DRAFT_2009090 [Mycena sp. CBHHK59/15]|nr:hypothetical protein B0H10DRAFT_2009090 [Mycena sp. CBHHK59/15]